jgi:acyl-CoA dehydrogenase
VTTMFGAGQLNGRKVPVADGEAASVAVVVARNGLVLVDLGGRGVSRRRVETIDPARKHAELTFADTPAELLGGEGEGWRLLDQLYDAAAVYFAFAQVGGAEAAMWMARDYALQRQAFGRAIGSYQAIKHKLADCYVKLELARSNAYYGAMMLSENGADLAVAAAAARVAATEAYDFASKENIQTHGGIGFTWEADTQFHLRRARLMALSIGGPMAWKDKLVSRLEQKNAA